MNSGSQLPLVHTPKTVAFGHLLIMVSDVTTSMTFYVENLGFTERPAKPLADGRPVRALRQGIAFVGGRKPNHRQMDHIAFEVDDVRGMRERLKIAGVEFQEDLHDGPYGLTIYITDPDGTRVELYQPSLKA